MRRNNYYPLSQGNQIIWLGNMANKLPTHGTVLGLNLAQIFGTVSDCNWLIYLLATWLPATRTWVQSGTEFLTEAQTGTGTANMILPVFVPPPLPPNVVPMPPGALTRIFALVQLIRDNPNCTNSIASDLGILGSVQPGPDYTTIQPVLTLSIVGNEVLVGWNWGGFAAYLSACEIQVDRNDGKGFGLLTIDTTPNYTDTQPFPGTRTVWTYRAIYRVDDKPVGVWSQPVSLAVPA